jgi:hypothetical protein
MNRIMKKMCLGVLLSFVSVPAWGLSLKVSRDDNTLGGDFSPDSGEDATVLINRLDCLDNILIKLTVGDFPSDSSSEKLYFYTGTDCGETGSDDCDDIVTITPSTAFSTTYPHEENLNALVSEISSCSVNESVKIWAFYGDDSDEASGEWSNFVTFDMDMDPPDVPTLTKATPGTNKMVLEWDVASDSNSDSDAGTSTGSTGDIEGYYLLYWDGAGGTTDADTDSDIDTDNDTDTDIDSDTDTDTDEDQDAGPDAGSDTDTDGDTDTDQSGWSILRAAGDTDTGTGDDDDNNEPTCPSGGFQQGDEFNNIYSSKWISGGDVTKGEVGDLTNGTAYNFAVVAFDLHRNVSVISNVLCEVPGETCGFECSYGGAGGKAGKFCFVATAAFGSYDHPVVKILRRFRDEFLEVLPGGKSIIAAYYDIGPGAAEVVAKSEILSAATRGALIITAGLTIPLTALGPVGSAVTLVLLGLILGLIIARRRRVR